MTIDAAYISGKGKISKNQEDSLLIAGKSYGVKTGSLTSMIGGSVIQEDAKKPISIFGDLSILAVSDGIAGLKYGEVASKLALQHLYERVSLHCKNGDISGALILKIIRETQNRFALYGIQNPKYHGMGATLAGVFLGNNDGKANIFNVGDSRVYLFSKGKLQMLSEDHTLARKMAQAGDIKDAYDCANMYKMLDSAIIASDEVDDFEISLRTINVAKNDKLLICTDGVTDMVCDADLEKLFKTFDDETALSQKIFNKAMKNGGADNLTLIIAKIN